MKVRPMEMLWMMPAGWRDCLPGVPRRGLGALPESHLFSAGGHMVTAMSTHFDKRLYPVVDAAHKEICCPDFAIALYPGHLWYANKDFVLNPNVPVPSNTPDILVAGGE